MSDASTEEASWFDQATEAVEQAYDTTAQAVEQAYDTTAQAVEQAYDTTAQAVEQAYDTTAQAVEQAYDWTVSAVSGVDSSAHFCDDLPEGPDPHLVQIVAIESGFTAAKYGLKFAGKKAAGAAVGGLGLFVTGYEIVTWMGDVTELEYYRQLCGEYYEQLLQQAQIGCTQAFQATCNADHGGAQWSGPFRIAQDEAIDDLHGHLYDWPDHEILDGDATVTPLTGDLYAAGCDADHNGSSWSGLERDTFDEAADDLVAHLVEWPDHQLDTDDGRPGVRVKTMERDPNAPYGYRP